MVFADGLHSTQRQSGQGTTHDSTTARQNTKLWPLFFVQLVTACINNDQLTSMSCSVIIRCCHLWTINIAGRTNCSHYEINNIYIRYQCCYCIWPRSGTTRVCYPHNSFRSMFLAACNVWYRRGTAECGSLCDSTNDEATSKALSKSPIWYNPPKVNEYQIVATW